jgi:GNAT superfamily N-acetyltransferase
MEIRKVGLADLEELREIGGKTYRHHYEHLWKRGGVEWYIDRCFNERFLESDLTDPNVEYYIIKNDVENVGMMKLVLKKTVLETEIENALYLEKLYFVKDWTGKGAGRKSIEFALERARKLGRRCVWLMAMDTSAKPIAAYEKSGFTQHSRTRLGSEFELMKEEFRGMIVMTNCLRKNGN